MRVDFFNICHRCTCVPRCLVLRYCHSDELQGSGRVGEVLLATLDEASMSRLEMWPRENLWGRQVPWLNQKGEVI